MAATSFAKFENLFKQIEKKQQSFMTALVFILRFVFIILTGVRLERAGVLLTRLTETSAKLVD